MNHLNIRGKNEKIVKTLLYFVSVFAFIVLTAMIIATIKPDKAEHYVKGLINKAYIHDTEITLRLQAHRDYLPCEGATRIVRLVTYSDDEHQHIRDVRFANETVIVDDNNLNVDEFPVYHLAAPLPGDLNRWYVFSDLHYNCPWWYAVVPNPLIRYFQGTNIHSPPLQLTTDAAFAGLTR